jgi:hypothetical protein
MKILTQNIQSNSFRSLANNLQINNEFAVVNDINNLAKALNDFMPHLLILESQNVTGLVKAFCDKNNVKIIAFGNNRVEDVDLFISDQQGFAELSVLSYKTDDDKVDVSIFLDDASQQLYASFLCQNYNVKSYGQAKLNSPKYLGEPTNVEQFEVLNKSKLSVLFNEQDKYASALLGCCPIVYGEDFNNIISLIDKLESLTNNQEEVESTLDKVQKDAINNSSSKYTVKILNDLGFTAEASHLDTVLEEQVKC